MGKMCVLELQPGEDRQLINQIPEESPHAHQYGLHVVMICELKDPVICHNFHTHVTLQSAAN